MLKVYRANPEARLPHKSNPSDVGWDLYCPETVTLQPGDRKLIDTGLVMQPAPGHFLMIVPRSSSSKPGQTWHLANTVGVVDPSYCGPQDTLKVMVVKAPYEEPTTKPLFNKGDRFAQVLMIPYSDAPLEEVLEPPVKEERGGFGSTGR